MMNGDRSLNVTQGCTSATAQQLRSLTTRQQTVSVSGLRISVLRQGWLIVLMSLVVFQLFLKGAFQFVCATDRSIAPYTLISILVISISIS